jgi:excisionase family DNA binding protein
MAEDLREFVTVEEFAAIFNITPRRVREEIRGGKVNAIKLGFRTQRISRSEVERVKKHGLEAKENEQPVTAA